MGLRKTMRVRKIVVLVRLSHSHGFAQKRNAFRIFDATSKRQFGLVVYKLSIPLCLSRTIKRGVETKSGLGSIAPRCLIHIVEGEFRAASMMSQIFF